MKTDQVRLPVPVLSDPHWRVNFRPDEYTEDRIPKLANCFEIIEKNKLSLRGWDYPHLSNRDTQRGIGTNWVASWSDFWGHREYWRFYQSGQFLHFFSVREATETEWRQKLQREMSSHLSFMEDVDWDQVPGFISILNFIYSMTEIFEFAARLCQVQVYKGALDINIRNKGIQGFILAAGWDRGWHSYYAAAENELGRSWSFETDVLVAESADKALNSILWFFERFGWLSPPEEVIRRDQENFLKGRI
jgi:hypothetical protein